MINRRSIKIFVDFDGTITKQDVGELMFLRFGDEIEARNIIEKWRNDEITSRDTWRLLCKTVENFDPVVFDKFLDEIEIDPTFEPFVEYCEKNGFDIMVVSDGLDYYINHILGKHGLSGLITYTNRLHFDADNNLHPSFPHTDEECIRCANCKRNHIINHSSDEDYTVYIGDGYSDACPVQFCDHVFAKHSLLKFCEINRISFSPYNNFDDVIIKLDTLKDKKRLKKRHQAELKRREVYLQG